MINSSMNTQLMTSEKVVRPCRVGPTHDSSSLPSSQVIRPMKMSLRMPATSRMTKTKTTQCLVLDLMERCAHCRVL